MNNSAPAVTSIGQKPVSSMNGYSGQGQTQMFAGDSGGQAAMQSVNKGGMRGLGLLAIAIAEVALKKKAIDLGKDYYKTNKKDYDFFKRVHQPMVQATVTEAMSAISNPYYLPDTYVSAPAGIVKASILDKQWYEARRRNPKYAVGIGRRLDYDFAIQRTHGVVAGWNLGRRYEEVWADEHNNRAFDKKISVSNIGVAQGNIVRQGLSAAVGNLASSFDNLGDTISSIGNGAAKAKGYEAGRAATQQRYRDNT